MFYDDDENDEFIIRERAKKGRDVMGYPPPPLMRRHLENLYKSITGSLDVGDIDTFFREVADLSYQEAKDRMISTYGTPEQLSEAGLAAKSREAEAKLKQAEQQARDEQRSLDKEFTELEEIARKRLAENFDLARKNDALEKELQRLKTELEKARALPLPLPTPPSPPTPTPTPSPAPSIKPTPQPPLKPLPPPPVSAPTPIKPPVHGIMYYGYKSRITQTIEIAEIDEMSAEISDIGESLDFDKLTQNDITELIQQLHELRRIKLEAKRITARPTAPPTPAPPMHGSLYNTLKININFSRYTSEFNRIEADIFQILTKGETEKLTDADITELLAYIRQAREAIALRTGGQPAKAPPKITRPGVPTGAPAQPPAAAPFREELGQYLFDFSQVPGRDTGRFIELMKSRYKMNWLRSDYIKKNILKNEITAGSPDRKNFLSLEYYRDRFTAILRFDTRAVELWAIPEDSHINIYIKRRISAAISRIRPRGVEEMPEGGPTIPTPPPTPRAAPLPREPAYRYREADIASLEWSGEQYVVDYELWRVINRNRLLPKPPFDLKWFELSPSLKLRLIGYDVGRAFKNNVDYLHNYSWYELINYYGIPQNYILAWGGTLD